MTSRTLDKLIYMANQIAREFGNQRPNDAVEATWDHLWHFWDPRMRAMIVAYLQEGGDRLCERDCLNPVSLSRRVFFVSTAS